MSSSLASGSGGRSGTTIRSALGVGALAVAAFGVTNAVGCEYVAQIGDRQSEIGDDLDGSAPGPDAADEDAGGSADVGLDGAAVVTKCVYDQAFPAATSSFGQYGTLARLTSPGWEGWASTFGSDQQIMFNGVADDGTLLFPSDKLLVEADTTGGVDLPAPKMVVSNNGPVLIYGRYRDALQEFSTAVRRLDVTTGALTGAEAPGQTAAAASMPTITGAVADGAGERILVTTLEGSGDLRTLQLELFSSSPARLAVDDSLGPARGAVAAWAPDAQVFGVAYLTINGGKLQTFDRDLNPRKNITFATPTIDPPWGTSAAPPTVAGAGGRFYVVWISNDSIEKSIRLNAIDAQTGEMVRAESQEVVSIPVAADISPAYPMILFDGQQLLVAWEEPNIQDFRGFIHALRFNPDLEPIGVEECVTCNATDTAFGEFGLANNGVGRFAVQSYSLLDALNYLVRMGCTSP